MKEQIINYENKLVDNYGFDQAIQISESKNFIGYLNNLYLVKKEGTRGVVAAGKARISTVLECTTVNYEEAKKYAITVGKMESENHIKNNHKEYKDITFDDINDK